MGYTNRTLFLLLGPLLLIAQSTARKCDRMPPYAMKRAMPGDNGFEIRIRDRRTGQPAERFESNQVYTVTLINRMVNVMFRDFYLVSVSKGTPMEKEPMMQEGSFIHTTNPLLTLDVRRCPGMIKGRRIYYFPQISIQWKAPKMPMKCVEFRATVIKRTDVYFKDKGKLTKVICPNIMHYMDEGTKKMGPARKMRPMMKECCACGTATYNMTFHGLWTKETHPKDWPQDDGMLHWTNLVGITHDDKYLIYYPGGLASAGVQSVCAYGDSSVLRQEFASKGMMHIKNLIRTKGMWGAKEMAQNRTAMFAVNRTYHFMSFLTMLGPSPDWCTGVAALDLCRADCTWIKNQTIDLYPWDAGIKMGNTYIPDMADRLDIPNPIREITSDWPSGNPFTPGKPVARLIIQRMAPKMDWQCSPMALEGVMKPDFSEDGGGLNGGLKKHRRSNGASPLDDPSLAQMATFLCITSKWTPWSRCSVTCGLGRRVRSRVMEINRKNELCRHVPLIEQEDCEGRKRTCDFSAMCSLLSWTDWSLCNATCEQMGVKWRSRDFARTSEREKCVREYHNLVLREQMKCAKPKAECDNVTICSEGLTEGYSCGEWKMRYYYSAMDHACKGFTYRGCKGTMNNFQTKQACENTCLKAVEGLPQWRREKMALLQHRSSMSMQSSKKGKKGKKMMMSKMCMLPMDQGEKCDAASKTIHIRWYYNYRTKRCGEFFYQGCKGNGNNFADYQGCTMKCMPEMVSMSKDGKEHLMMGPKKDCQVSDWSHWGPCSKMCNGLKQRWRRILRPPMNGGKPCGILYEEMECDEKGAQCGLMYSP